MTTVMVESEMKTSLPRYTVVFVCENFFGKTEITFFKMQKFGSCISNSALQLLDLDFSPANIQVRKKFYREILVIYWFT